MRLPGPPVQQDQDAVSPLELFFDLVFIFAVSQLSHHLLNPVSWRGAAETLVLLIAVFGVWSGTSYAADHDLQRTSASQLTSLAGIRPRGSALDGHLTAALAGLLNAGHKTAHMASRDRCLQPGLGCRPVSRWLMSKVMPWSRAPRPPIR
jgi:hypothetical protein